MINFKLLTYYKMKLFTINFNLLHIKDTNLSFILNKFSYILIVIRIIITITK